MKKILGNIQHNFALDPMFPALLSQYPVRCLAQKCSPKRPILFFKRTRKEGLLDNLIPAKSQITGELPVLYIFYLKET